MRLLSIDNVNENMQIARNIYDADGRVLLAEGMRLSGYSIQRLKELSINSLYINDDLIGKVEVDELVRIQTKVAATNAIKETMTKVHDNKSASGEKVYRVMTDIIDEIISNRKIPYNLVDIRAMNDYLFSHCLTVCVLSVMTGVSAGFNYQRLKELGVGAILHDIGKILISDQIINKSDSLTPEEYTEIQKHSQLGYEILKTCNDISSVAAHIAWQHHERIDGSGYPRGIKGQEIHEFARITAIADVYDALATDRVFRNRLHPHEVIEFIRDGNKGKFDPEYTKLFIENIAPFPIGSSVLLNNGEKGIVIKVSKDFSARPIIRVMYDQAGVKLNQPMDRDLKQDLTIFIIHSLKDNEV